MTNEQKAKNMTKGFLKEGLIKKSRIQELLIKAMEWKEQQLIDKLREVLSAHMHGGEIDEVLAELDEKMKGE